jgi:hypothetical protein
MSHRVLESPGAKPQAAAHRGRGIGVMFFAFFGSWWMGIGLTALYGTNAAVIAAVATVGLSLLLAGWRRSQTEARTAMHEAHDEPLEAHQSRVFRTVNIAQWLCIVALLAVLNMAHHAEWIVPGIMLIVGVHFFPLAKLFRYRLHYLTGTALTALAASYPFFSAEGPQSPVGPIGAGLILWLAAAVMLADRPQR